DGSSKLHADGNSTVLLLTQVIAGGVVSTTDTVCEQAFVLPQASVTSQVRVALKVGAHSPALVTVVKTMMPFVPPMSQAVGRSKSHAAPNSTVLLVTQVMAGAVVSTTVTVWLHRLVLPQASVASHVRLAVKVWPQVALVSVVST